MVEATTVILLIRELKKTKKQKNKKTKKQKNKKTKKQKNKKTKKQKKKTRRINCYKKGYSRIH